jgi:CBS domain-containing protein/gamma-glutamylcysteine synthetase
MGKNTGKLYAGKKQLTRFMHLLINDIKALEKMLAADMFEKNIQRIGAEQELCLLDKAWRPAPMIMRVLEELKDDHFTTEHSQYNLEINLEPLEFTGNCFSKLENSLKRHLSKVEKAVKRLNGEIILVGILPTIRRSDLKIENLTPLKRYHLLGDIMRKLRGGPFEFRIEGADELITKHDSIMFEGCNTSFQVHFQVSPDAFVNSYNWAMAISGPVLAACTNSPILLGKRLWHETRIALFQQSVDSRSSIDDLREKSSRITFGNSWVRKSIAEIFQEDIARYRVVIGTEIKEDSLKSLDKGKIPALEALQTHNGTVYKWNRACYGITDGKPHLRIENRILPAGPTVVDEIANAAFWLGLMNGIPKKYDDVAGAMEFDIAKLNFTRAAQTGIESHFRWFGGKLVAADKLIFNELLPISRDGLEKARIAPEEIDHFLGIVEERVRRKRTGAKWILNSFANLRKQNEIYEACVAITAGIVHRQKIGDPVSKWTLAEIEEAGQWVNRYWKVEQIMSTDLFTVQEGDSVYFAANIMNWKKLRYIPVEDEDGRLLGLLTQRAILEYYSAHPKPESKPVSISEIMLKNPLTVTPDTLSLDALMTMRKSGVGCLPVIRDDRLVGLLTEHNFLNFSEHNIEQLIEESKRHISNES